MAVLALVRVVLAAAERPSLPREMRIVDAAYAMVRFGASWSERGAQDGWAHVQLAGYAAATGAFGRYADVLGGARECAVVLCACSMAVLVAVLHRHGAAVALALAMVVVSGPAVAAVATFGPGLLGVTWAAVGGALTLRAGIAPRVLGVLAVVVGIATAPLLAAPVAVLVAAAVARRSAAAALVVLSFGAAVVVLVLLSPSPDDGAVPVALLVPAGVLAVAGLLVPGRRGIALAGLVAVGAAVLPWAPVTTLAPALVGGSVLLAAGLVEEAGRRLGDSGSQYRHGALVAAVTAVTVSVVVAVVVTAGTRPAASPHLGLAGWIRSETDPATTFSVPDEVRSDLLRDGVLPARITPDATFVVRAGAPGGEPAALAVFGSGEVALTVTPARPTPAGGSTIRAQAGAQLAGNRNLTAPPAVLAVVREGGLDDRALVLLAGLTGRGSVTVSDLPVVAGENLSLPRHRMLLSEVDAATTAWLRAQQPPFAPTVSGPDGSPSLSWPLPAPTALLGR